MELLTEIAKKHNHEALTKYLADRCLKPFDNIYFCSNVLYKNHIYSGLFIISHSLDGKVNLIENRSLFNVYTKLYQAEDKIPIWGVKTIADAPTVIVTESVLDSETISQLNLPDISVISLFKASYSLAQFHYLMYGASNKTIITAFDNDDSGIRAGKKMAEMSVYKYNKTINSLPFPHKDINLFRCRSSSGMRFKRNIQHAIKGVSY